MTKLKKRFIGEGAFYRRVLAVAVPIVIQMCITNFVNLLDNVMVGRLSTEAMSGVSIVNQFTFVFNLLIFGATSAAGIFTAQYHGSGDVEGVRHTFRFKFILNLTVSAIATLFLFLLRSPLINSFLHESESGGDLLKTFAYGEEYLLIMLLGLIPYALSQVYTSTLREISETIVPMCASLTAVFTNLVFNYILIFGKLGSPALGVKGAAIATVISRFVELLILVLWTHSHPTRVKFIKGVYRSLYVPGELLARIVKKGLPLIANELLFSLALTVRNQFYSTRGLDVVASLNIATTVFNMFNVVHLSLGSAIAIIVGNLLGAGKTEEARDTDRKMIAFSVFSALMMAILLALTSPFIPLLYNVSDSVRDLATYMLTVTACIMPFLSFNNACYYTVRAGGKTIATILLDSGLLWFFIIPTSFIFANFTSLNIHTLYPLCQALDISKSIVGAIYVSRGTWVRRLVNEVK